MEVEVIRTARFAWQQMKTLEEQVDSLLERIPGEHPKRQYIAAAQRHIRNGLQSLEDGFEEAVG